MSDSIFVLACDDGFQLRARAWGDSLTNPKGLVVLVHGMAEYGARYEEFAAALVQANYRVWCADHRGHGLNITDANPNGHVADHDTVGRAALDTLTVVRRALQTSVPVFLIGHSFGTSVVRRFLQDQRDGIALELAGVGLSSTAARLGMSYYPASWIAGLEGLLRGPKSASGIMEKLVFGSYNAPFEHRTDWDWISSDSAVVDSYIEDPLCGFNCSAAFWRDHLTCLPVLQEREAKAFIPFVPTLLLLAGTADPLSLSGLANGALGEAYAAIGTDVLDIRVPLGRHEVLSDENVIARVVAWLDAAI